MTSTAGEVLFDPFTIPGCCSNPPAAPACQGHGRGVVVIRTAHHGHVCWIPLGMSAASSVVFDPGMLRGARVRKGQEMGMFRQGGSSFVLLFEKLPGKELVFVHAERALNGSRIGVWCGGRSGTRLPYIYFKQ